MLKQHFYNVFKCSEMNKTGASCLIYKTRKRKGNKKTLPPGPFGPFGRNSQPAHLAHSNPRVAFHPCSTDPAHARARPAGPPRCPRRRGDKGDDEADPSGSPLPLHSSHSLWTLPLPGCPLSLARSHLTERHCRRPTAPTAATAAPNTLQRVPERHDRQHRRPRPRAGAGSPSIAELAFFFLLQRSRAVRGAAPVPMSFVGDTGHLPRRSAHQRARGTEAHRVG